MGVQWAHYRPTTRLRQSGPDCGTLPVADGHIPQVDDLTIRDLANPESLRVGGNALPGQLISTALTIACVP